MDMWEWTKIGVATTGSIVIAFALGSLSERAYPVPYITKPAYVVEGVTEPSVDLAAVQRRWPAGLGETADRSKLRDYIGHIEAAVVPAPPTSAPPEPAAPPPDLPTLLAAADPARGKRTAQVCVSCHTFDQGGGNRIGPNLWGIIGHDIAAREGFGYSSALSAEPGEWTYERLDRYLANPAKAIPGNKMAFLGIRNAQDRANVLAFLRSLSDNPAPLPAKAEIPVAPPAATTRSTASENPGATAAVKPGTASVE